MLSLTQDPSGSNPHVGSIPTLGMEDCTGCATVRSLAAGLLRVRTQPRGDRVFVDHVRGNVEHHANGIHRLSNDMNAVHCQKRQTAGERRALVRVLIPMILGEAEDVRCAAREEIRLLVRKLIPWPSQRRLYTALVEDAGVSSA